MDRYVMRLDFDAEGEPPAVYICDTRASFRADIIEVFEAPMPLTKDWSWAPDDWEPGSLAKRVLALLNEEGE